MITSNNVYSSLVESGLLQLGEAGELGPNASVMCRIATLSAWAELEIATESQPYLVKVVEPHRKALASLWIGALRDYASIRADTELMDDATTGGVDSSYSSLGKEVLLPVSGLRVMGYPSTDMSCSTIVIRGL